MKRSPEWINCIFDNVRCSKPGHWRRSAAPPYWQPRQPVMSAGSEYCRGVAQSCLSIVFRGYPKDVLRDDRQLYLRYNAATIRSLLSGPLIVARNVVLVCHHDVRWTSLYHRSIFDLAWLIEQAVQCLFMAFSRLVQESSYVSFMERKLYTHAIGTLDETTSRFGTKVHPAKSKLASENRYWPAGSRQ